MSACAACGGRGRHVGGCPATGGPDIRARVRRITQLRPAARQAEEPGPRQLAGKVLGFRQWTLDGHRLRPMVSSLPFSWRLGPNQAQCLRPHINPNAAAGRSEHAAPHPSCECGLYAYHEPSSRPPEGDTVTGAVLAWGRIEVHRSGFRAEYAEPVVLGYNREQPFPAHPNAALHRG